MNPYEKRRMEKYKDPRYEIDTTNLRWFGDVVKYAITSYKDFGVKLELFPYAGEDIRLFDAFDHKLNLIHRGYPTFIAEEMTEKELLRREAELEGLSNGSIKWYGLKVTLRNPNAKGMQSLVEYGFLIADADFVAENEYFFLKKDIQEPVCNLLVGVEALFDTGLASQ